MIELRSPTALLSMQQMISCRLFDPAPDLALAPRLEPQARRALQQLLAIAPTAPERRTQRGILMCEVEDMLW
mgnify:CR=1 FL=1